MIEGEQACKDRIYRKEESKMENTIEAIKKQLNTEELVTKTIRGHLGSKQNEL